MITQEKFLNTLNKYRECAEGWTPSIWGEDTKDLLRFIEHLIADVKSLEDNVWMNAFVAGMILEFFRKMKPSDRFEPHLRSAKSVAKYLLVYMPNDRTGTRPDQFYAVRDNVMAHNISKLTEIEPLPKEGITNETPL